MSQYTQNSCPRNTTSMHITNGCDNNTAVTSSLMLLSLLYLIFLLLQLQNIYSGDHANTGAMRTITPCFLKCDVILTPADRRFPGTLTDFKCDLSHFDLTAIRLPNLTYFSEIFSASISLSSKEETSWYLLP